MASQECVCVCVCVRTYVHVCVCAHGCVRSGFYHSVSEINNELFNKNTPIINVCVCLRVCVGHGADVKCVDWHPTKGLVVSGSKDSQQPIKFWDPKTGQSLATL